MQRSLGRRLGVIGALLLTMAIVGLGSNHIAHAAIADPDLTVRVKGGTGAGPAPTCQVFVPCVLNNVASFTDLDGVGGDDAGTADFYVEVGWGDGSTSTTVDAVNPITLTQNGAGTGSYTVSGTHTYTTPPAGGGAILTVTVEEDCGTNAAGLADPNVAPCTEANTGTGNVVITANPATLTIAPIVVGGAAGGGTTVIATCTDPDALGEVDAATDFIGTINFGDGTSGPGTVTGPTGGPFTITATHTYTVPGTYTVTVTCSEDGGAEVVTATATITVATPGGPTLTAIGCANSGSNLAIFFPANTTTGLLQGTLQDTSNAVTTPAQLYVLAPVNSQGTNLNGSLAAVECGAVFQDMDAQPNNVPGASITYTLTGGGAIAQITESNLPTYMRPCGSSDIPGGYESCQGAVAGPLPGTISPTPANIVHVSLKPGVTFSLVGGFSPAITISALYQEFPNLGNATISTGAAVIGITGPVYSLTLTPSPNTISSAAGSTGGSTITASLARVVTNACIPLFAGSSLTICGTPTGILGSTVGAGIIGTVFAPGAEPGVVTFSTTSGVFGNPASVGSSGQQIVSVHCGAAPATTPVFLVPFIGQPFSFSFTSCVSVSATLFGGGAAGTAVVTATYVGDFTGATATAATTVALSAVPLTISLSRGCNEVITGPTVAAAATAAVILGLVSPSSVVVSMWQFNNSLHAFQAFYFSTAGAPVDINAVGPNQSIFICVSGPATFQTS